MKNPSSILLVTTVISLAPAGASNLDLEPCINGTVSASGMYVSEEAEAIAQDPCLNGDPLPANDIATRIFASPIIGVP